MTYCLRIADMPETERPRERLMAHGPKVLATAELIANGMSIRRGIRIGHGALGMGHWVIGFAVSSSSPSPLTLPPAPCSLPPYLLIPPSYIG